MRGDRHRKLTDEQLASAVHMYRDLEMSVGQVADHFGVTRQAMWDRLRKRTAMRPQLRHGQANHFYRGGVRAALGRVLGDLSSLGYDASWQGLRAADVGAPHGRFRVFVTAWPAQYADGVRRNPGACLKTSQGAVRSHDIGGAGATVADSDGLGHERSRRARHGRPEPARLIGGPDTALSGDDVAADSHSDGLGRLEELHGIPRAGSEGRGDGNDADGLAVAAGGVDWGKYEPAIRRWERRLGRPAPEPTELSAKGSPRLSPRFVEFLMGLPAGWVTDVPGLTRNEQLKALGNGVVPQQAAAALRMLLADVATRPVSLETEGVA